MLTRLLCFEYSRGLKQAKVIKIAFAWVLAGFVGTQLALFVNCRPFAEYWAVPTRKGERISLYCCPNPSCVFPEVEMAR